MTPEKPTEIYFFGEGRTDLGEGPDGGPPDSGVLPILVHALCGKPRMMAVSRRRFAHLQGKGLWQKVRFAKHQARRGGAGAVFVVDSEGDDKTCKAAGDQMRKGRDAVLASFPMAIGVAHPCIEAWLLADASAIRRGLDLTSSPVVPDKPEELPAPRLDKGRNPKRALAEAAGSLQQDLARDNGLRKKVRNAAEQEVRDGKTQNHEPPEDEEMNHARGRP